MIFCRKTHQFTDKNLVSPTEIHLTTYRKREYSQKLIDNIESIWRRIYGKSN